MVATSAVRRPRRYRLRLRRWGFGLGAALVASLPSGAIGHGVSRSARLWPRANMAFARGNHHATVFRVSRPPIISHSIAWERAHLGLMEISVANGFLYGGTVHSPYQVSKLSALTGKTQWTTPVSNQVMTTPLIYKGLVIVGTGNRNWPGPMQDGIRGTGTNQILALSDKTGKVVWRLNTAGENMPTPVIYHHVLYQVGGSDQILAVNPETGKIIQKVTIPSYVSMSAPEIWHGIMYFGAGLPYAVYAVKIPTLKTVFRASVPKVTGGLDDCPPAVAQGRVIVDYEATVNGKIHGMAVALNASNGKVEWTRDLGYGTTPRTPSGSPVNAAGVPVVVGHTVYVGSPVTQKVYAMSLVTGRMLWHSSGGDSLGKVNLAPQLVSGHLLVGGSSGKLISFNAATGKVDGIVHNRAPYVPGAPTIANGTLFVGTKVRTYAIPLQKFGLSVKYQSHHP